MGGLRDPHAGLSVPAGIPVGRLDIAVGGVHIHGIPHFVVQAHGDINHIDTRAASEEESVLLAITGDDIDGMLPPINGMQVKAPEEWSRKVAKMLCIPAQPLMYDATPSAPFASVSRTSSMFIRVGCSRAV